MSASAGLAALTARAPAKVNLGLFVGPRRADGRHELVSVMQSISLCDELTLAPAQGAQDELSCPGVAGAPEENLALRALAAFRAASGWRAPAARVTVLKRVPVAAGLGGGSADAAAVLRLAAAASGAGELPLPAAAAGARESRLPAEASGAGASPLLLGIAATLGADVPAQVRPGRWLAQGAGELLRELPGGGPLGILVLPSAAALSTAAVYAELDRLGQARSAEELRRLGDSLLGKYVGAGACAAAGGLPAAELLVNDLQAAAIGLQPSIGPALAEARAAGADLALVSGSGPTVLGLFGGPDGPARARRAAAQLRRSPAAVAAVPVDAAFGAVAAA